MTVRIFAFGLITIGASAFGSCYLAIKMDLPIAVIGSSFQANFEAFGGHFVAIVRILSFRASSA